MSDPIDQLSTALAKAQGELRHAIKNATNPHFRNNYADLAEVIDSCGALSDNGLAYSQTLNEHRGKPYLYTTLMHKSGQYMMGRSKLLLQREDSQGLGSAITYSRRQGLSAIVGIAQKDDDGESEREFKEALERRVKVELQKKNDEMQSKEFMYPLNEDLALVDEYLALTAKESNSSIDYIKARAAKNQESFLKSYKLWKEGQ